MVAGRMTALAGLWIYAKSRPSSAGRSPMRRRTFSDRTGRAWMVSESPPRVLTLIIRRERPGDHRSGARALAPGRIARSLEASGLQFESSHERRRVTPIPFGWEQMSDDVLEDLLGASTVTPV